MTAVWAACDPAGVLVEARNVLIVDSDPRGAAILELSLQRVGYSAVAVPTAEEAIVRLEESVVDLVISDTALGGDGGTDGFALLSVIKAHPRLAVPVIILSSSSAVADKVRGLELGAEDFLCKPISVHELVARIRVLFARRAQQAISTATRAQLTGSTDDLSVVDLMQTFEVASKSGTLTLRNGALIARLLFRHGSLVDATLGKLKGQEAAFRAILWGQASFEITFTTPDKIVASDHAISGSTAAIILEGLRRSDDWGRLLKDLPPLGAHVTVRADELLDKLADIPDEVDGIIKLLDGSRTLLDVIDESPFDDVSTLETLVKLSGSGLLLTVDQPDVQPMSLSTRVLSQDAEPSSHWVVPLPGADPKPPASAHHSSGAISFAISDPVVTTSESSSGPVPVGKIALKRDDAFADESAPSVARHDPRAEPPTPLPQPPALGARVEVTMPSAMAPPGLRESSRVSVGLSEPPSVDEARRWKIRVAVFAVVALLAGFMLVAGVRGCADRAKAKESLSPRAPASAVPVNR